MPKNSNHDISNFVLYHLWIFYEKILFHAANTLFQACMQIAENEDLALANDLRALISVNTENTQCK